MEVLTRIRLDKDSHVPYRDQIKGQVAGLIHAGLLAEGEQLPTIRALAVELGVNVNTVAQAYREMHLEGLIATRRGEGTFVSSVPEPAELERLRIARLDAMLAQLFDRAARLGYAPAEVVRAMHDKFDVEEP
jgi:GntR family transcriptional regulator